MVFSFTKEDYCTSPRVSTGETREVEHCALAHARACAIAEFLKRRNDRKEERDELTYFAITSSFSGHEVRSDTRVYSGIAFGLIVSIFYRQSACFATKAKIPSLTDFVSFINSMLSSGTQSNRPFEHPPQTPVAEKENRRIQRISLPLPVRVEVTVDSKVNWNEITRLSDVSAFGAGFSLKRPVKRGRLVRLTIPMPRQLRSFDFSEPQYKIWGVVRRCIQTGRTLQKPEYSIGVGFTGKTPPAGYHTHPTMLYDISHRSDEGGGFWQLMPADLRSEDSDLPKDLRQQTRFHIPEALLLERVDEAGTVLESETTVTENISLGGAAVLTSLCANAGTFFRVTSERFSVTLLSVVRGSRVGADGISRLHLEFIDRYFPLEGID